jgi:septal ring-binding cell division protein DamX
MQHPAGARAADATQTPSTAVVNPSTSVPAESHSTPVAPDRDADRLKLSASLSSHSDLLEQRLLATERWLDESQGGVFSIQLLGSNDSTLLRNYFEKLAKYIEIEKVFVYRTVANQQPSITVLYGAFTSRLDAVKSLEALPEELKVNRPYIRTVQGIRVEIGMKKPS